MPPPGEGVESLFVPRVRSGKRPPQRYGVSALRTSSGCGVPNPLLAFATGKAGIPAGSNDSRHATNDPAPGDFGPYHLEGTGCQMETMRVRGRKGAHQHRR